MFRYDGRAFTPFPTEVDAFLRAQTLYKGTLLPDGTLGLSTISGGGMILDARTGRPRLFMNLNTGLPADNGLAIFADRGGNVWLALEGAICQVETPSPLTRFDIRAGLSGSVSDVVRHKGRLYAATGVGVFYLDPGTGLFKQVTGFREGNSQATALATDGDVLVVGYGSGLHQIDGDRATLIKANVGASFSAGTIRFSTADPRRLWVGLEDGLASMRRDANGRWVDEGRVPGLRETTQSIVEAAPNEVWLGTAAQGVLRIRFRDALRQDPVIDRFGKAQGLPDDSGSAAFQALGRPLFVSKRGVFRFDEGTNRFLHDDRWKDVSVGGTQDVSYVVEDHLGNIWANFGRETGVFRRQSDGSFRADTTALLRFADLAVAKIYPEPDGVVWFGRDDGLIRYDPAVAKSYATPYTALVRRVTVGDARVLYDGAMPAGVAPAEPHLGPSENALRFEFASTSYDNPRSTPLPVDSRGLQRALVGVVHGREARLHEPAAGAVPVPREGPEPVLAATAPRARMHSRLRRRGTRRSGRARSGSPLAPSSIVGFVRLRTQNLKKESRRLEKLVEQRTREIRDRETEVRAQAEELQTLDETVKAINREVGLKQVLHALLEQGMKLFPKAEKGTFLIRDLHTERFVFAAHQGYRADELKGVTLSEEDVMQRYAEGTERVERGCTSSGRRRARGGRSAGAPRAPQSMLAMTVAVKGRLEGILVFDNMGDAEAFSTADVHRLTRFREHAVAAVTKARTLVSVQEKTEQLQQQNEKLEQANENVELLSRIGRDITRSCRSTRSSGRSTRTSTR